MSSSRSDDVTQFVGLWVCVSVVILFDLKHLKQDAVKVLQRCLVDVSGCLKGVHRVR